MEEEEETCSVKKRREVALCVVRTGVNGVLLTYDLRLDDAHPGGRCVGVCMQRFSSHSVVAKGMRCACAWLGKPLHVLPFLSEAVAAKFEGSRGTRALMQCEGQDPVGRTTRNAVCHTHNDRAMPGTTTSPSHSATAGSAPPFSVHTPPLPHGLSLNELGFPPCCWYRAKQTTSIALLASLYDPTLENPPTTLPMKSSGGPAINFSSSMTRNISAKPGVC